jgi:signal peptidase I
VTAVEHRDEGSAPWMRLSRIVRYGVGLLLLANALVLFAPTALGGRTSYVVTQGTSMLPHFHADGLVLTRAQSTYHVGEIVAYHNQQLRTVVMHRIVATDGTRFVMKGDNNNFRDSYHPRPADIVGKEWVYVAGGGRLTQLVRTPLAFAILLAVLGFVAGTGITPAPRKRTSHAH